MVIKIQDGSIILAGDLLSGVTKDEEGKNLKFEPIEGSAIPRYQATSRMSDGSDTTKIYTFDLQETLVRVNVSSKSNSEMAKLKGNKEGEQKKEPTTTPTSSSLKPPKSESQQFKTEKAFKTVGKGEDKNNNNNKNNDNTISKKSRVK